MIELVLFDYGLLFILIISGVTSYFRGFFKEALSLASWLVAAWVAWRFVEILPIDLEEKQALLENDDIPACLRLIEEALRH